MNSIDFVFKFGRRVYTSNLALFKNATILGLSKNLMYAYDNSVVLVGWKDFQTGWSLSNYGYFKNSKINEIFRRPPPSDYFNYKNGYWMSLKNIKSIEGITQSQLECVIKRIQKIRV